jgi:methyl-accepting chemotaxis protein
VNQHQQLPFHRSLVFRFSALGFGLFLLAGVALAGSIKIVRKIAEDAASLDVLHEGGTQYGALLALSHRRFQVGADEEPAIRREIQDRIGAQERRFEVLRAGDAQRGIRPIGDPRLVQRNQERERVWRETLRPLIERVAAARTVEQAAADLPLLDARIGEAIAGVEVTTNLAEERLREAVHARQRWAVALFAALILLVLATFVVARKVAARIAQLAAASQRVAAGESEVTASVGGTDEVAMLATAFEDMTVKLRRNYALEREGRGKLEEMFRAVGETAARLATAANEILASTTEQTSGAQQQLVAVSQTMSSLDEVTRTSERAAERAKEAADTAKRSDELGRAGHGAVDEAVDVIGRAKDQADGVAQSILELAEQATAIGDITTLIDDLAEQTNVLALNAAIEATKAGEHGKGFSVVAGEVKSLADQSRRATAEVRQVLGEIQKRANRTVLSTEESTRSLEAAMRATKHAGEVIRQYAEIAAQLAHLVSEISTQASQQASGIGQITQAVRDISNVASQYVSSTKQSELAARDLTSLGERLRQLLIATAPANAGAR